MLNAFTNTRTWVVASLMAAASIFGQDLAANTSAQKAPQPRPSCDQKPVCPPKPCCPERPEMKLNCAYNAPARVEVDSCSCWDFYFGASFIYWEAMQDNMEFAAVTSTGGLYNFYDTAANSVTSSEIIGHDFSYKPGFKVLAGMNFDRDHWDGYFEYTWFKSTTTTSVEVGADPATFYNGVVPTRGNAYLLANLNASANSSAATFNSAGQEWTLKFQSLDAALARTYYVGTQLTFRTIMGARFAWFSQKLGDTFSADGTLNQTGVAATYNEKQNFSSWGAGLVAGLNTKWMLGEGFSMIGNGSFDLLYTRVQTTNAKFKYATTGSAGPAVYKFPDDRPDFVMPHASLEFGFAWGSYFDCYNWHVDFAATYGFQVFWDANLFRDSNGSQVAFSQRGDGNLYLHGLNISARLDF